MIYEAEAEGIEFSIFQLNDHDVAFNAGLAHIFLSRRGSTRTVSVNSNETKQLIISPQEEEDASPFFPVIAGIYQGKKYVIANNAIFTLGIDQYQLLSLNQQEMEMLKVDAEIRRSHFPVYSKAAGYKYTAILEFATPGATPRSFWVGSTKTPQEMLNLITRWIICVLGNKAASYLKKRRSEMLSNIESDIEVQVPLDEAPYKITLYTVSIDVSLTPKD